MALAVLIGIWGVFLGVALVRKRAEHRADSSIGAFQRQLQVLRRNSQAVDRSQSAHSGLQTHSLSYPQPAKFAPFQSHQLDRTHSMQTDRHVPSADLVGAGMGREIRQDPYFRPGACERRRDVLLVLISAFVSTGLISVIPAARMFLVLTAISGFALLLYVVVLVKLRSQAFEREMKLRYMPAPAPAQVFVDRRVIAR